MNKVKISLATFCFFLLTSFGISAEERTTRILVTATEEATLSSEISAKIISIPVKAGSNFRKSDILIEFDCSFFEAQKDVVQAELDSARVTLKSNQELATMRSIGEYEVQLSQIAVDLSLIHI